MGIAKKQVSFGKRKKNAMCFYRLEFFGSLKASLEMLRWIGTKSQRTKRRKYRSFQLQGNVVIVSCHEVQTNRQGADSVSTDVLDTMRITYGLRTFSICNRGISMRLLFIFVKSAPQYDRLMGIVRSFPANMHRIKLLYRQVAGCSRRRRAAMPRPPKFS